MSYRDARAVASATMFLAMPACSGSEPAAGEDTSASTSGSTSTMDTVSSNTASSTAAAGTGSTGTPGATSVGSSTGVGGMTSTGATASTSVGGTSTADGASSSSVAGSSTDGSASGAGGATTTGNTVGAGGSGASGGTGGSNACPAAAALCEDFESGNLDQWQVNEQGGSLSIGSTFVANGSSALLVDVPVGQTGGYLRLTGAPLFPLSGNMLWGRAMVFYEGSVPPQHTDVVRGSDASSSVPFYNLGSQIDGWPDAPSGVPSILLNYYVNWPDEDCWARPNPTYEISADTWMCWEWKFDGGTNQIEFYIDGSLERLVDQTGDGCLEGNHVWEAPDFGSFEIGALVQQGGATEQQKIWIDDVAVGSEARLGCP